MTTTRFSVPAMDCPTEKTLISNRLERISEVDGMDFDLLDRVVTVRHREGADARIEAALREIGMDPKRIVEAGGLITTKFHVPAMCCPTEQQLVAKRLDVIGGIGEVSFDLIERVVTVTHAPKLDATIEGALHEIGMKPARMGAAHPEAPATVDGSAGTDWKRGAWLLGIAGATALASEMLSWAGNSEQSLPVVALALISIVCSGPTTFRKAFVALRTLTLNINLLMTIAVIGAVAIGQWPEAAMVTVLFAIAELIESRSVDRARDAIRSLMALTPETARVRRGTEWVEVATGEVRPKDLVRVLPGERVPLDGHVTTGTTSIDQAPITGESIPVDKGPGDQVFAGTINQHGAFEIEVSVGQEDSTVARIGRTIREAQSQKAPAERFVDRFARWYTPTVVVLAVLIATLPPLTRSDAFEPWIYKALVLLVVACPCALVISTPVTIVSGLAAAAKHGILVKGGAYLEEAARLRMIAVDKTGTLTEGKPQLVEIIPMPGVANDDLLRIAASLESTSTHPLAQAVVRGWTGPLSSVSDARNIVGKGIEGTIDGAHITIGSHRLLQERGVQNADVMKELARLEANGNSIMVVWSGRATEPQAVLGVLGLSDVVRATSIEAVKRLHAEGIQIAMLTGDNEATANAVGAKLGIDRIEANLLPEDKLATIDRLVKEHRGVGMVGDGVNDAPALARANVGFAMGAAGTDTAIETADVALMKDDLRSVPELIDLSRRTTGILKFNIALSIAIKVVFFALAFVGVATLWMAVFADMGASLLVAANGLRLLRFEPRHPTS